jgi:SAM-dependent methyltransferase
MRTEDFQRALGRRFARLVTNVVTRFPALWPVFRRLMGRQFDGIASRWEEVISPEHLEPLQAALASLDPPSRALDLGTGTGLAAFAVARRFPQADVVGADLAAGMIGEARRKTPPKLAGRVHFEVADASRLPYRDGQFDLVSLSNMIPFFDELARVTAPGGAVVLSFSGGSGTPIYVSPERLRAELGERGFTQFTDFAAGNGTALVARKGGAA